MAGKNKERRIYSDALKVSALTQYNLTKQVAATAKEFNIPQKTLSNWIKEQQEGEVDIIDFDQRVAFVKKDLIKQTLPIMQKALKVIDQKLEQCSAPQAATVYGILHDKMALMQGQNIDNTGNTTNITINNIGSDEALKLMEKAATRMRGKDIIDVSRTVEEERKD